MKKSRQRLKINFDVVIVIVIALLMIFLINFADIKMREMNDSHIDSILFEDDTKHDISEIFADEIVKFRPESCKMVETYDENFNLLVRVMFNETHNHSVDNIKEYPELVNLLKAHDHGHTRIDRGDATEDVYFTWSVMGNGKKCIVIIYTTSPLVKNLWLFNTVCYIVLILIFILLIKLQLKRESDEIKRYNSLVNQSRDIVHK